MKSEVEVRILDIQYHDFVKKLEDSDAKLQGDYLQKRYVYDFNPKQIGKWIRLRTNGRKTTLTIKNIVSSEIDGTKELEIEVSDFEKCNFILNQLGYVARSYQENRRRQYLLNGVEIDLDFWPLIPTYAEIEASNSEDVYCMVETLGYSRDEVVTLDVDHIYEKYGYHLDSITDLRLEEERK